MRTFRLGERTIDLDRDTVTHGAETQGLTPLEAGLLGYLAHRPGELVSREELLAEVWGYRAGVVSRTIDNMTRRLRSKIEDDPSEPQFLRSAYGRGLMLDGVTWEQATSSTRFVGREAERAALVGALNGGARLVTVCGTAGVGKTRLVTEALAGFRTVDVPCGPVRTVDDLDRLVISRLGVSFGATVQAALGLLGAGVLVLDECEGAIEPVVARTASWTAAMPRLRIVTTSRRALGAPGERVVPLEPLESNAAVELFLSRSRQAMATEVVAEVVARAGYLPLAIELVAARAHLLGPKQLVDSALDLLGGTMDRVLERSWGQMSADERRALACASVFESPFDADDLAAVVDIGRREALDRVASLVEQSLLRVVGTEERRYVPYTVVRDRARRDLADPDPAHLRHAARFARLGDRTSIRQAAQDALGRTRVRSAASDLAVAMDRTEHTSPDLALACATAWLWLLASEGPLARALPLVERVARLETTNGDLAANLAIQVARIRLAQGDPSEAVRVLEAALAVAVAPELVVTVRCGLAIQRRGLGDADGAMRELEAVRPLLPSVPGLEAFWLHLQASWSAGNATGILEQSAELAKRRGDLKTEATSLTHLAVLRHGVRGEWSAARRNFRQALALCENRDFMEWTALGAVVSFGSMELELGRLDEAEPLMERALALAARTGSDANVAHARVQLARVWMARGLLADALAMIEPQVVRTGRPTRVSVSAMSLLARIHEHREELDDARQAALQARDEARALGSLDIESEMVGLLAVIDDDPDLLEAATTLAKAEGSVTSSARVTAQTALIRACLGDAAGAAVALGEARVAMDRLGLQPESDVGRWFARAQRELAELEGRVVPGRFG